MNIRQLALILKSLRVGVLQGLPMAEQDRDPIEMFGEWFETARKTGLYLPEAMTLATRIGVMNHGEIVQTAEPHDVYEYPNSRFVAEFIVSLESAYISRLAGSGFLSFALRTSSASVPNSMNVPASPTR